MNSIPSKYVSDDGNSERETQPELLADMSGEFSFCKVEEEDVLGLLRNPDTVKTVSPDGISAKLWKMAALGVSSSLTSLFNFCIKHGQILDEWKHAKDTPVPIVSSPESAHNY